MSQSSIEDSPRKKIWGLHPNVFFLGIASLLTDISSEMIFTLVPLFVVNVLKETALVVGLIGGLSESTDAVFRIFSGRLSDRFKKRKLLTVLGYGLSTVIKPFMLLAGNGAGVLGVRFGDRVGKGIRSSPRDALIADSAGEKERGKSFGAHRAMDTSGAFLGLIVAAVIIYAIQGGGLGLSRQSYHWLVIGGIIPAVLGVLVLTAFVREKRQTSLASTLKITTPKTAVTPFSTRFKLYLLVMAVFSLGNSSDFFVILRAQDLGTSALYITLMLVVFNATYVAVSIPAGILSDRLGRRGLIALGWTVYALVYLGFAVATQVWHIWVLFACYGIYYGIVEGVARAYVADLVPAERRGTAYGYFNGVVGLTLLPASVFAGWLWDAISPAAPFYLGGGLAFLAMIMLALLMRGEKSLSNSLFTKERR